MSRGSDMQSTIGVWQHKSNEIETENLIKIRGTSVKQCGGSRAWGLFVTSEGHLWRSRQSKIQSLLMPLRVIHIAVSEWAALMIINSGQVFSLGQDSLKSGILGVEGVFSTDEPLHIKTLAKAKIASITPSCAGIVDSIGSLYAWGDHKLPHKVLTDKKITSFSFFKNCVCAFAERYIYLNRHGKNLRLLDGVSSVKYGNRFLCAISKNKIVKLNEDLTKETIFQGNFDSVMVAGNTILACAKGKLYEWNSYCRATYNLNNKIVAYNTQSFRICSQVQSRSIAVLEQKEYLESTQISLNKFCNIIKKEIWNLLKSYSEKEKRRTTHKEMYISIQENNGLSPKLLQSTMNLKLPQSATKIKQASCELLFNTLKNSVSKRKILAFSDMQYLIIKSLKQNYIIHLMRNIITKRRNKTLKNCLVMWKNLILAQMPTVKFSFHKATISKHSNSTDILNKLFQIMRQKLEKVGFQRLFSRSVFNLSLEKFKNLHILTSILCLSIQKTLEKPLVQAFYRIKQTRKKVIKVIPIIYKILAHQRKLKSISFGRIKEMSIPSNSGLNTTATTSILRPSKKKLNLKEPPQNVLIHAKKEIQKIMATKPKIFRDVSNKSLMSQISQKSPRPITKKPQQRWVPNGTKLIKNSLSLKNTRKKFINP